MLFSTLPQEHGLSSSFLGAAKGDVTTLMKTIIQMSHAEEVKALPILLRHSADAVLPNQTYVVNEEPARKLREAGVQFTELSRESNATSLEGVGSGERI